MLRVVARMTLSSHSVPQVAQLRRELRRAKRSIRDTDDIKRRLQTLEQETADLRTGEFFLLVVSDTFAFVVPSATCDVCLRRVGLVRPRIL